MFKFTRTNYCHTPPSFGGGSGIETIVCFSKSPKRATSLLGQVVRKERGHCECPQLVREVLEKDGKIIFDRWV
jgi:hypothetical protein